MIPFKRHNTPLSVKKLLALRDTEVTQGLLKSPIKMLLSGKKKMTGTLHTSTVRHFKTPTVHKYYNSTKYSCITVYTWVSPKHASTSMHSALTISGTLSHN